MATQATEDEEQLPDLLFNLASSDRLKLLTEIAAKKQRMSSLSKIISASVPECSRHLARLSASGLVMKDSGGLYEVTLLGRTVIRLLPALRLTLTRKDYFLKHDLSFLPAGYVERIGELEGGRLVSHVSHVLEYIKTVVSEGKDHIWLISDHLFPQWPGIGSSFPTRDIPVRMVCAQTIDPKVLHQYKTRLIRSEIGALKEVNIAMVISEQAAGVCFPTLDGGIDFGVGFAGTDSMFRGWCSDLFEYYWLRSRRVHSPSPFGADTSQR